jgi:hypothetical protein
MYPRRIALRRVLLEGNQGSGRHRYVVKVASLRLEMGETVGLKERAELNGRGVCMWVRLKRV